MLEFRGQNGLWVEEVRESAIQRIKEWRYKLKSKKSREILKSSRKKIGRKGYVNCQMREERRVNENK